MNDPKLPLTSQTTLLPTTEPIVVSYDLEPETLTQQAIAGRLELLDLELKLAADLVKIEYLRNQTLPMFMLDYEYGTAGRDFSASGAASDAAAFDKDEWSIGLQLEIPVSNELRESRLRRAVFERQQRLATRQLRELTVHREIHDAVDQLRQNWQRILAARQNVLIAGRNYDAELTQFKEGLRTMTEVLETLTRLGESQIREIRAITDYQVSQIDLAFATGTLLGRGRVDLGANLPTTGTSATATSRPSALETPPQTEVIP